MDLKLDDDDLNICVQCGLCLPFCPTFRVTGEESKSPRGRIHLMREVQLNDAPVTDEVLESFNSCVQCRGCEPACPSAVPYGHLMEQARESLADAKLITPTWQRLALKPLSNPALLQAGSKVLGVAQRAGLVPKRLGISHSVPLQQKPLATSGTDVYLFTGCVMDAWQRDVHAAAKRVLEAAGIGVTPTENAAPCCGALHAHAGLTAETRSFAEQMMANLVPLRTPGSITVDGTVNEPTPILVDSAGCGAAMKDYGHLLGTPEAEAFSARVFDIQEWLAERMDRLPAADPVDAIVAVQDPCHLRHVQRVHEATRTVLSPYVRELVELDDDGLCCGAGGAYSVMEPEMAGEIRKRKITSIGRADPDIVASANPGCSMHLAVPLREVGMEVAHPMQLVDRAINPAQNR